MRCIAASLHGDDGTDPAWLWWSRTSHFNLVANFRPHGVSFYRQHLGVHDQRLPSSRLEDQGHMARRDATLGLR